MICMRKRGHCKSGQVLLGKAIIGMLIALACILILSITISRVYFIYFAKSDEAAPTKGSFNELVSRIGKVSELEEGDSHGLLFIGKGRIVKLFDAGEGPPNCEGQACICLCKDKWLTDDCSEEGYCVPINDEIQILWDNKVEKDEVKGGWHDYFLGTSSNPVGEEPVGVAGGEVLPDGNAVHGINLDVTKVTATKQQIISYLQANGGSRMKETGEELYDICISYGVDPGFAIGVAMIETSLAKAGKTVACNNFYNIEYRGASEQSGSCPVINNRFGNYETASDMYKHFCRLISKKYVAVGQNTPAKIVCLPGSGFKSHCYCCDSPTGNVNWAKVVSSVRKKVSEV